MWRDIKVCVAFDLVNNWSCGWDALFIEETRENIPVRSRPPTLQGSGWCCHLSPRSRETRPNKNYISAIMWLLLRLVCLGLGGESGWKHRLLNGEWTLAVLPVNLEKRETGGSSRQTRPWLELLIGHMTPKNRMRWFASTQLSHYGLVLPREQLQADVPAFRLLFLPFTESVIVMVTELLILVVTTFLLFWFCWFKGDDAGVSEKHQSRCQYSSNSTSTHRCRSARIIERQIKIYKMSDANKHILPLSYILKPTELGNMQFIENVQTFIRKPGLWIWKNSD